MFALYRKYAPKKFRDVKGQDFVVKVLKNLIAHENNHHSIIFSGIHGIGKTLLAKIFAKAINCLDNDNDNKPCLTCENCISIENNSPDIMEIDGATYTGIDNIRKVIDDTKYLPISLKYKIYIIDEVHRLSRSAFDSLLKTLESPPERVKFIFATTDINNVPDTILSRCLSLSLQRISKSTIVSYLLDICAREKWNIPASIMDVIADESDGSMRDSLSILQVIALSELEKEEDIIKHLKIFSQQNIFEILERVLSGRPKEAIDIWHIMQLDGYSEKNFFHKLSEIITKLFLVKTGNTNFDNYQKFADFSHKYKISYNILIAYWEIIISQTTALYSNCSFTVETTIIMLSHVEDRSELFSEANKLFPNLKVI